MPVVNNIIFFCGSLEKRGAMKLETGSEWM